MQFRFAGLEDKGGNEEKKNTFWVDSFFACCWAVAVSFLKFRAEERRERGTLLGSFIDVLVSGR